MGGSLSGRLGKLLLSNALDGSPLSARPKGQLLLSDELNGSPLSSPAHQFQAVFGGVLYFFFVLFAFRRSGCSAGSG